MITKDYNLVFGIYYQCLLLNFDISLTCLMTFCLPRLLWHALILSSKYRRDIQCILYRSRLWMCIIFNIPLPWNLPWQKPDEPFTNFGETD